MHEYNEQVLQLQVKYSTQMEDEHFLVIHSFTAFYSYLIDFIAHHTIVLYMWIVVFSLFSKTIVSYFSHMQATSLRILKLIQMMLFLSHTS